jgi:hypothetical protein
MKQSDEIEQFLQEGAFVVMISFDFPRVSSHTLLHIVAPHNKMWESQNWEYQFYSERIGVHCAFMIMIHSFLFQSLLLCPCSKTKRVMFGPFDSPLLFMT